MTYTALTQRQNRTLLRDTEMIYPAPTESRTRILLHDTEALLPGSRPPDKTSQAYRRRMHLDRCHLNLQSKMVRTVRSNLVSFDYVCTIRHLFLDRLLYKSPLTPRFIHS